MSFMEHLSELRLRLPQRGGGVPAGGDGFVLRRQTLLRLPDAPRARRVDGGAERTGAGVPLRQPTEPFWVYTKARPVRRRADRQPFHLWELWKFVAPGLYKKEKRMALVVTLATALCFIGGAVFGYRVLSTPALTYLLSFAESFPGSLHFKDRARR